VNMTANVIDERLLAALYLVWPIPQRPAAPEVVIPAGYAARSYHEPDLPTVRKLIDSDGPIHDKTWEELRDRIVPEGAFLMVQAESGQPVATASALHNPRAGRYYYPFGGQIGYVTVDAAHRRQGLGRAVVALAVGRLIAAGYRHIFVGAQGWRLPAVRCYLGLGFVPFFHDEASLPRWRRIYDQIGRIAEEWQWPWSLAFAAANQR
jgi:mycothiol synthase